MDLKELSIEELEKIREELVGKYIGEWNKPKEYFEQLLDIDCEIRKRLLI